MKLTLGDAEADNSRRVYQDGQLRGFAFPEDGRWKIWLGFTSFILDDLSHLDEQLEKLLKEEL